MIKEMEECVARVVAMAIDTDGTIGVVKSRNYYAPSIYFCNTNCELVEFVKNLIDEAKAVYTQDNGEGNKMVYYARWQSFKDVLSILWQIAPYLIAKREQASLAIELCVLHLKGTSRAQETLLINDIHTLNKKGVRQLSGVRQ